MYLPNLKFVALPVPEIIGGTPKIWAVPGYAHAPFSPKFLMGFCLHGHREYTCQNPRQASLNIRRGLRRLQESVPAHEALHLAVNSCAGHRPDDRTEWKRPEGRPRQTWIRQLEIDVGLVADAAWDMAGDRDVEGATTHRRSSGPVSE